MRPHVQRHIAAMHIVMRTGCTLPEANAQLAELRRRAAAEAHEAWRESLGKKSIRSVSAAPEKPLQWWQRD